MKNHQFLSSSYSNSNRRNFGRLQRKFSIGIGLILSFYAIFYIHKVLKISLLPYPIADNESQDSYKSVNITFLDKSISDESKKLENHIKNSSTHQPTIQCEPEETQVSSNSKNHHQEKYITYLPHSGFTNQRISLINGIILAWYTNRTLIVPPIILGKTLPWKRELYLQHLLAEFKSGKIVSETCRYLSDEEDDLSCQQNQPSYTLLPWDYLFDMEFVRNNIRMINRPDFSFKRLISSLGIVDPETEIHYIQNKDRYYPQFFDDSSHIPVNLVPFKQALHLCELRSRPEKLVHMFSIFGSSRLRLRFSENLKFRKSILDKMLFSHPALVNISKSIIHDLGGLASFIGVHLRMGDLTFQQNKTETIERIVEALHEVTNIDQDNLRQSSSINCRFPKNDSIRSSTSKIIYIATDAQLNDTSLSPIFNTYPCILTLLNFTSTLESLNNIVNPIDNSPLKEFLLPMIDLLVVAHSKHFVGTPGSTFSGFAANIHNILVPNGENLLVKLDGSSFLTNKKKNKKKGRKAIRKKLDSSMRVGKIL
ncbi:hypothetical protein G9A89_000613 [Geosiphon pyriformis]|nr:hypothetical protein G9A89_000613 [Geosiphon pyriformis]